MIAFKPSFQARTLPLQARSAWRIVVGRGRRRTSTWATPRAGTFERAGYSRLGRQLVRDTRALMRGGECGVVNQGCRPIQKARDRFPGAGLILAMLKICQ